MTPPTKTLYETGDELDLTGIEIKAVYTLGEAETLEQLTIDDVTIDGYDMSKKGNQTVRVTYQSFSDTFDILVNKKYDEPEDSMYGLDENDVGELYEAFANKAYNYSSSTESFFNSVGLYDYYRHYQKNYVQDKNNIYTEKATYSYPLNDNYLSVLNTGYVNLHNNYYSFSLEGDDIASRLSYEVTEEDLSLVKENTSYQDDLFTIDDLNEEYFVLHNFKRISEKKFASIGDSTVNKDFVDICAPKLINTGYYMTFKKVTIELDPLEGVAFRIRLYAEPTQSGKLVGTCLDSINKPNWYMLFSEALIYDINNTSFAPTNNL